jgi:hypothetical protein
MVVAAPEATELAPLGETLPFPPDWTTSWYCTTGAVGVAIATLLAALSPAAFIAVTIKAYATPFDKLPIEFGDVAFGTFVPITVVTVAPC